MLRGGILSTQNMGRKKCCKCDNSHDSVVKRSTNEYICNECYEQESEQNMSQISEVGENECSVFISDLLTYVQHYVKRCTQENLRKV